MAIVQRWTSFNDDSAVIDFPANNNNSASFKFKTKLVGRSGNGGTKDVKIMVLLKYLSNFWRTLEMLFINCKINLILTWSANCFKINDPVNNQIPTLQHTKYHTNTDTKPYVPVVTL